MSKQKNAFLAFFIFILLVLALNPQWLGLTLSSISFTETLGSAWLNIGGTGQMAILVLALIVMVSFIVTKDNR